MIRYFANSEHVYLLSTRSWGFNQKSMNIHIVRALVLVQSQQNNIRITLVGLLLICFVIRMLKLPVILSLPVCTQFTQLFAQLPEWIGIGEGISSLAQITNLLKLAGTQV